VTEPVTLSVLLGTALTIAVVHTLIGVDHTLPFVVLGRARGWTLRKVLCVTALCGLGHVLSSVLLGLLGVALGAALERLQWLQAVRGSLAAWLLIAFGGFFTVRGLWRSIRRRSHSHAHVHTDGVVHAHAHHHGHPAHAHPHPLSGQSSVTVWTLFIIFVLGPCEPLIPLMLAPAALHHWTWVVAVSTAFGLATIATMSVLVAAAHVGLSRVSVPVLARHAELLAGLAIAASGIAIQTLGI
jgi:ABC-type nickel/cobalt efflux system permease component RcnA